MYVVSSALRIATNKDGTIVLDVQHGRLFRFNATACLILTYLQRGTTEAEIVREISEEFNIVPEVARRDICDLINALERNGLVHATSDVGQGAIGP